MDVIYTDKHRNHAYKFTGPHFEMFELPERAEIILHAVQQARFERVRAPEDHGMDPVRAVHEPAFLEYLQSAYRETLAYYGEPTPLFPEAFPSRSVSRRPTGILGLAGYYALDADSPIVAATWEAAYWSVQCALTAADRVAAGGEPVAYALCRPPGHHAASAMYGGFCYLNNAAICARYLQSRAQNPARIAILDVDFHHGNGTQEIFYADPTVLFCSLHGDPDFAYPHYSGWADEEGIGPGRGYNRNYPLPRGTGNDVYLRELDKALEAVQAYAPEFLIVSVGLDTVGDDPYGGFTLDAEGLHALGVKIAQLRMPTILLQEGGYLLPSLGAHAVAFLSGFNG